MHKQADPKLRVASITLLIVGIVLIGFFGARILHAAKRFDGRRPPPPPWEFETDVSLIREWMTIPYIARMYHVPGRVLFDAVQISPDGNDEKSLEVLNHEFYPNDDGYVLTTIQEAILANQPPFPPDTQPAPTSPVAPAQP